MDLLEKILIGIVGALLTALVIYSFKLRQLYLLVPKLFGYSALTEKGKLLELRAFNKGRAMEEEVHIDMPPALTYELVAADHPDVKLQKNKLLLARIAPRSEISMILLAEGNLEAESFSPTLSSKTTKGKLVKKLEEVPPNAGAVVLSIVSFVAVMALMFYLPQRWIEYQTQQKENEKREVLKKYAFLEAAGWRGLEPYVGSQLRQSYSSLEFPVIFQSATRKGDQLEMQFAVTNKTAALLKVTAYADAEPKRQTATVFGRNSVFDAPVNPMQSLSIVIAMNTIGNDPENLFVRFSFEYAEERLWGVRFYPVHNESANRALQGTAKGRRP